MITIRPATTSDEDAEVVGRLMLDAFPTTFTYIFGDRDRQAAQAVGYGLRAFGSLPDAWLAETDSTCIGLILVRWENRATPFAAARAFRAMAGVLGPMRTLQVAYHIPPLPPHWLHVREAYISALAVTTTARRRGHGSALLKHAINVAISRGYAHITLRVDKHNQPALELFQKHTFMPEERRFQFIFNLVRRHFGQVIMTRRLTRLQ